MVTNGDTNQLMLSLERDLLEIEKECGKTKDLEVFLREYRSLFEQLNKSEESVKRLGANNRQLQAEILANNAKLPFAKQIMTDSDVNMVTLKKDVENSLTEVLRAQSQEKEKKAQVNELRKEIEELGIQLDKNVEGVHKKQPQLEKTLFEKSELTVALNEELAEVAKLRDAVQAAVEEHESLEKQRMEIQENSEKLSEDLEAKQNDVTAMEQRRDHLKDSLESAQNIAEETEKDIDEKKKLLRDSELNIERIRRLNNEHKISKEKMSYESDVLAAKYTTLQEACKAQHKKLDDLTGDTKLKTEEVKAAEQENENYKFQIAKVDKVGEVLRDKIDQREKEKLDLDHEKRSVREKQLAIEAEQEDHNKRIQIGKRDIKKSQVEDRRIKREKATEAQRTKDRALKFEKSELNQKLLKEQIQEHQQKYAVQFQENAKTDKQRLEYMSKAMQFQDGYLKMLEKDKEMEDSVVNLKKEILAQENQEKCLKNMCEAVRNDINLANRTMLELRTDMMEMKQSMQTKLTEVEQLKSEVDRLTNLVRHEEKAAKHIEQRNYDLKDYIEEEEEQGKAVRALVANQHEDYLKMLKTMGEIQFEKTKHEGEFQKIVAERNLLDKQIISRNLELKSLYEKLKLQSSLLVKGEKSYAEKEDETERLKEDVRKLFREKAMLKKKGDGAISIRDQIEMKRRELNRNRHACRVLEDEVQIPVNVHRWRSLQGSDPSSYALIEKLQILNQRYLRVCAELSEKQQVLHAQEKMYVDMKHNMMRQPGPEVSEQLTVYQAVLKEKAKQLKAMRAECKQFEKQEVDYKEEIQSVVRELTHVKKKFFTQMVIDAKHEKMGKRKSQEPGPRPQTTTPRDTPRLDEAEQNKMQVPGSASKVVKFSEDEPPKEPPMGGDGAPVEESKQEEGGEDGENAGNPEGTEPPQGDSGGENVAAEESENQAETLTENPPENPPEEDPSGDPPKPEESGEGDQVPSEDPGTNEQLPPITEDDQLEQ